MTWRRPYGRGWSGRSSRDHRRGHLVEIPPGPPPWDKPEGLTPAGVVFLALVGSVAVAAVVSVAVTAWRLIDQVTDLR